MAVFNAGHYNHRQNFYGNSTDTKPTDVYNGDKFTEIDTSNEFLYDKENDSWELQTKKSDVTLTNDTLDDIKDIKFNTIINTSNGTATGGSGTTIVDSNKNYEVDVLKDNLLKVVINNIEYIRVITGNTSDTITFPILYSGSDATSGYQEIAGDNPIIGTEDIGDGVGDKTYGLRVNIDGVRDEDIEIIVASDGTIGTAVTDLNTELWLFNPSASAELTSDGAIRITSDSDGGFSTITIIDDTQLGSADGGFIARIEAVLTDNVEIKTAVDGADATSPVSVSEGDFYEIFERSQDVKITDSDVAIPVDLQFHDLDEPIPTKDEDAIDNFKKIKNLIGEENNYLFNFQSRDNDYLTQNFDLFYATDSPFEISNYMKLRTIDDAGIESPAMLSPKTRPENSYSFLEIKTEGTLEDVVEKQSGVILRASEDLTVGGVPEYGIIVYLEKDGAGGNFKVHVESALGVIDTAVHQNSDITISVGGWYTLHVMAFNDYEDNKISVNITVEGTPVAETDTDSFFCEIDLTAVDAADRDSFMKSTLSGVYYGGEAAEAIDNWNFIVFGYDFVPINFDMMYGQMQVIDMLLGLRDRMDMVQDSLESIKNIDGIKKIEDDVNVQLTGSNAVDDEQLTVTNVALELTSTTYGDATRALITVEGADIRFRLTGDDPTAEIGHPLRSGECITLLSSLDIVNFKAIRASETDAVIYITYS